MNTDQRLDDADDWARARDMCSDTDEDPAEYVAALIRLRKEVCTDDTS